MHSGRSAGQQPRCGCRLELACASRPRMSSGTMLAPGRPCTMGLSACGEEGVAGGVGVGPGSRAACRRLARELHAQGKVGRRDAAATRGAGGAG